MSTLGERVRDQEQPQADQNETTFLWVQEDLNQRLTNSKYDLERDKRIVEHSVHSTDMRAYLD